jgi:hypothetical protein
MLLHGQREDGTRAASRVIPDNDRSVMIGDDTRHHCQPHANPIITGCKERIEDPAANRGWNAGTMILNGEVHLPGR